MTGAQAAEAVVRYSGLEGVTVRPVAGHLTDHYDPRSRTLNLSESVGQAATVAALGVAAHEAGHAIQDARNYRPMRIRQTVLPAAQFGQSLWFLPVIIGLVVGATGLVTVGLILFSAVVLFQLVTLPVEFDASKRALVALDSQNLLDPRRGRRRPRRPERGRAHLRGRLRRLARAAHLLLPDLQALR